MHWFEFKSKMASVTNVVFMDDCMMFVVFLISMTHKVFQQSSSSPFLALSSSKVLMCLVVHAFTFTGNTYLVKSLCAGFSEVNDLVAY